MDRYRDADLNPPLRMTTLSAGVRAALSAARFGCMMAGSQVYVPGLTTRA